MDEEVIWRQLKELAHVDNDPDANREDCNEILMKIFLDNRAILPVCRT